LPAIHKLQPEYRQQDQPELAGNGDDSFVASQPVVSALEYLVSPSPICVSAVAEISFRVFRVFRG
jgi:hypothetical protein